jgi:restriction system protein
MARRKPQLTQLYEARQKAKLQQQKAEERARQAWATEECRAAAQAAKEQAAARREEQRADRARQQQGAEAARRAAQQEREAARQAAAQARNERQSAADAKRATVERRTAEAEFRSSAVQVTLAALDRLLTDRNRSLAALSRQAEDAFNTGGPEALVDATQRALASSLYPDGLDGSCAAKYIPEAAELWVEYELPRQRVMPPATAFKYVKAQDKIVPTQRKPADSDRLYDKLIARLALRTLAEAFDFAPVTLVTGIVFNGYVSDKDHGTGQPIRPLLLSVHADREAFSNIVLDEPELDPTVCLRSYLNAVMSPHPWDLEAVKPVVQFDLSRCKFVDEMSVAARLDSRPELLALKPVEFEHLIRELFEARAEVLGHPVVQGRRRRRRRRQRRPHCRRSVHHPGQALQQDRRPRISTRPRRSHGRHERRQGRPRHHLVGRQSQPRLRCPQRQPHPDHRRPRTQAPPTRTPRDRCSHYLAQASARLATARDHVSRLAAHQVAQEAMRGGAGGRPAC